MECGRYTANSVWLSILFAAVLTVVTVALTRPILELTNTPADIIDMADAYIRTIFAGIPFTLLYNVTRRLYAGAGGQPPAPLFPDRGQRAERLFGYLLHTGLRTPGCLGRRWPPSSARPLRVCGAWLIWSATSVCWGWSQGGGPPQPVPICAELCRMGLPMGLQVQASRRWAALCCRLRSTGWAALRWLP